MKSKEQIIDLEKYNQTKHREKVEIICPACKTLFWRVKSKVSQQHKKNRLSFCRYVCFIDFKILNPSFFKRTKSYIVSGETKLKISAKRKAYLAANRDKHVWKRHSKFKSIPCEAVKAKLRAYEIYFEDELEPLLHLGRHFSIDIAFPSKKIGFEINGNQHYTSEGSLKPYYQNRHDLIESEGWTLYEIPYHVAMRKDFTEDFIVKILEGVFPANYDTKLYLKQSFRPDLNRDSAPI